MIFDVDNDMWAYAYMKGWNESEHIDPDLHDRLIGQILEKSKMSDYSRITKPAYQQAWSQRRKEL